MPFGLARVSSRIDPAHIAEIVSVEAPYVVGEVVAEIKGRSANNPGRGSASIDEQCLATAIGPKAAIHHGAV
jgi:hypothetical protein